MPGIVPFLPLIAAVVGGVDQNIQNKNTIKNAQNAATAAQAGVTQNQANAQNNLSAYTKANPGVAGPGSFTPATPSYAATSIPLAGAAPPGTASPSAGASGLSSLPPQVQQILASLSRPQVGQVA